MNIIKPSQLESLHHPCMCPTQSDRSVDQNHHHAEKKKIAQNWHLIKAIQTTKENKTTHYYYKTCELFMVI